MWEALEVAQAADFVRAMPGGLEARIEQGGTNVSGGQRQRLSIARALVRKPDIYLFDDSFSALDLATDARLRAALVPYTRDAAVVIVAQRVSTISTADEILVLEDGRIVGIGTHDELLASCPTYAEIVESQIGAEERGMTQSTTATPATTTVDGTRCLDDARSVDAAIPADDVAAPRPRPAGSRPWACRRRSRRTSATSVKPPVGAARAPSGRSSVLIVVLAAGQRRRSTSLGPRVLGPRHRRHHRRASAAARWTSARAAPPASTRRRALYARAGVLGLLIGLHARRRRAAADVPAARAWPRTRSTPSRSATSTTQQRGDLLSRVTNDLDNLAQSLQQTLSQMLTLGAAARRRGRDDVHDLAAAGAGGADHGAAVDLRRCGSIGGQGPPAVHRPVAQHRRRSTPRSRRPSPATPS